MKKKKTFAMKKKNNFAMKKKNNLAMEREKRKKNLAIEKEKEKERAREARDVRAAVDAKRRREVDRLVEIMGLAGVGLNKADFMRRYPALEGARSITLAELDMDPDDEYARGSLLRYGAHWFAAGRRQEAAKAKAASALPGRVLAVWLAAQERVGARWPGRRIQTGLVCQEVANTLKVSVRTVAKAAADLGLTKRRRS